MHYDGTHRRIVKAVQNSADLDCTYHFYYDNQWRIIEERNGSDQVIRQNVFGNMYIDELIQTAINRDPIDDPAFDPNDADHDPRYYFAAHDANFNILGIVDTSGVLTERYEYTPYGQRTVYFSPGVNDPTANAATTMSRRVSLAGSVAAPYGVNAFGHQGLMHDEESGLVQNRYRMLHPRAGRFMQRDPLNQNVPGGQYHDGMSLPQYLLSSPSQNLDSYGLATYKYMVDSFVLYLYIQNDPPPIGALCSWNGFTTAWWKKGVDSIVVANIYFARINDVDNIFPGSCTCSDGSKGDKWQKTVRVQADWYIGYQGIGINLFTRIYTNMQGMCCCACETSGEKIVDSHLIGQRSFY